MKKILLTITGFVVTLLALAQSPNLLNYQGVARNAAGNVLPSQPVGLRLSILSGSPTGTVVYQETRNVTTNAFGLFNVQVGSPGAITTTGTIAAVNWTAFGIGSGTKYLQVEIDPIGGTSYFNVGSTQLVSVAVCVRKLWRAMLPPYLSKSFFNNLAAFTFSTEKWFSILSKNTLMPDVALSRRSSASIISSVFRLFCCSTKTPFIYVKVEFSTSIVVLSSMPGGRI